MVPGIHDKNSNPLILFSKANSDNFLSVQALPATIISFGNNEILENFFANLITIPSKILSEIKVFEPAPRINILSFLPNFFKNVDKSNKVSGLKYTLVFPPILNQLLFFKS